MKRILCILALCGMLFAGCSQTGQTAQPTETVTQPTETETRQTEPMQTQMTVNEILAEAAKWLEKDCNFIMTYRFMNPGVCGMQLRSEQMFGEDGSRAVVTVRQVQYPGEQEIQTGIGEFYYRYEGSEYVCYSRIDDQTPQRGVVTDQDLKQMNADKALLVGAPCLMPDYLSGLALTDAGVEEMIVLSYWLPLDKILTDSTFVSAFVNNAFGVSGKTRPLDSDASIFVLFQLDATTCQPMALTCYFNEVRSYLLPESALTGEVLEDQELMIVDYRFDYDLVDSVPVPGEMTAQFGTV